jgi:diaminohydroxyphosphoribosylaminopyrimidine deaminase/5-amino-6-(5-phosphoribosylamino)uracil reductase
LKIAQTLDGKIASSNGNSKWITSESSREYVHFLRSISDAILVGITTVLNDNPNLNIRFFDLKNEPYKIVLDSNLRIPEHSTLVDKYAKELIIIKDKSYENKRKENFLNHLGVKIISVNKKNGFLNLNEISEELFKLNIMNVLVEGGGKVFGSFIENKSADYIYSFIAPKLLGGGINATEGKGFNDINESLNLIQPDVKRFEKDILISGKIKDYAKHVLELTEKLRNRCSRAL